MSLEEELLLEAGKLKRMFEKNIDGLVEIFLRVPSNIVFLRERAYFRTEPYRDEDDVNLRALYFIPQFLVERGCVSLEKSFILNSIKNVYSYISESIRNIFEDENLDENKRRKTSIAVYKHTKNSLKAISSYFDDESKKEEFKKNFGVKGYDVLNQYYTSIRKNFFSKSILFFSRKLVEEIESLSNHNENSVFNEAKSIISFYSFFFEDIKRMSKNERIIVKTFFENTKSFYDKKGYKSIVNLIENSILEYF